MRIKDIPWYNRPGIRLKRKGVSVLSDAELIAIVLGRGNSKENAIDISNRVLKSYNFDGLSSLSFEELKKEFKNQVPALKMIAMFEVFRRTNKVFKKVFKTEIKTAKDVYRYFVDHLQDKKKEHFYALLLNSKNQIISEELISVGTLNTSLIHPREVFNPAIKASANSIILVHNHPSGDCEPSDEDKQVTKMICNAGEVVGIKVSDHIVIGKDNFISLRQEKML